MTFFCPFSWTGKVYSININNWAIRYNIVQLELSALSPPPPPQVGVQSE